MNFKIGISSILIIFFLFSFNSYSQEPIMHIEGNVTTDKGDTLKDATVKIYRGFILIEKYKTDSLGIYPSTTIKYKKKYKIVVKKKGFTTKKVTIDAKKNYIREDVEQEISLPVNFRLLKKKEGVDYSIVEKTPVAKIHIDNATGLIDYDFIYINKRKKEIEAFLAKYHN